MKNIIIFLLFTTVTAAAQPEALSDRYRQMKDKSQTFKDYKVIKEVTLDAFWRSVEDSLAAQRNEIAALKKDVNGIKSQMDAVKNEVKQREDAVADILFDSNHITVAGVAFHKGVFISGVLITIAGIATLLVLSIMRSQWLQRSLKEKSEALLVLNSEHEEYKHRAVEKQMKLSRELQDERNKLADMRSVR